MGLCSGYEHNTERPLILGPGFAAKGHTAVLRSCGITIDGIVSRTKSVVTQVAADVRGRVFRLSTITGRMNFFQEVIEAVRTDREWNNI